MSGEGRKALLFLAVAAALGGLLAVFGTHLLGRAAGPEGEIITLLKNTETRGMSVAVGSGGKLVSTRHHFDRIVVEPAPGANSAEAVTTLDFEGNLGASKVSSLGLETLTFERRDGEWRAMEGLAPRLSKIAEALEVRRRALEAGDLEALSRLSGKSPEQLRADPELSRLLDVGHRTYTVSAWYLRSERGEVLIGEEYRLEGETAARPVDEKGTRRLRLNRREGEFIFDAGLM